MKSLSLLFLLPLTILSSAQAQPTCTVPGEACTRMKDTCAQTEEGCPNENDIHWLQKIAQDDRFEIELSNVALTQATTDAGRAFAQRLIADHTAHLAEVEAAARELGVDLPESLSDDQQVVIEYFQTSRSCDWDRDFTTFGVVAHRADIALTEKELQLGQDPRVLALAQSTLPVLQMHLEIAQQTADSVGDLCTEVPN